MRAQVLARGPGHLLIVTRPSGLFDAALGLVLLAGDALGVDAQQHVHAVARPVGDLRSGYARVEPGRDGRVPQIVGASRQQRGGLAGSESSGTGLVEDQKVRPVVEDAAAWAGEDAPVRAGWELLEVLTEKRDQLRVDGHWACLAARTVLELAALASGAAIGPPGAAARLRVGQDQLAPSRDWAAGKVVAAQVHGFFWPQGG